MPQRIANDVLSYYSVDSQRRELILICHSKLRFDAIEPYSEYQKHLKIMKLQVRGGKRTFLGAVVGAKPKCE